MNYLRRYLKVKKYKPEEVKELLLSTKRENIDKLINAMDSVHFFETAASTKFHGCYAGGLMDHSMSLYTLFKDLVEKFNIKDITQESMIICAVCHDLCKGGAYIETDGKFKWNSNHPKGHSTLSINRIKKFIELTEQEETIIRYHMGMYGTRDFSAFSGEYSLKELADAWNNNKLSKLFYFCDDMSTQFLEGVDE